MAVMPENGAELFVLPGGKSATNFHKPSEGARCDGGRVSVVRFNTGYTGQVIFVEDA